MRSRTGYVEFAEVTLLAETQSEEMQPATYRETAAAIVLALAEAGLDIDPADEDSWSCEIELLDEDFDEEKRVPNVTLPTKH